MRGFFSRSTPPPAAEKKTPKPLGDMSKAAGLVSFDDYMSPPDSPPKKTENPAPQPSVPKPAPKPVTQPAAKSVAKPVVKVDLSPPCK